jgi:hypothetical protein
MVNSCAVCGCCTRTDIVREHLEDTLRICDVSAKGLYHLVEEIVNGLVTDVSKKIYGLAILSESTTP